MISAMVLQPHMECKSGALRCLMALPYYPVSCDLMERNLSSVSLFLPLFASLPSCTTFADWDNTLQLQLTTELLALF
jgi:hypothetical protein